MSISSNPLVAIRGSIAHCAVDNLVDAILLALRRHEALGVCCTVHDGERTTYREYFRGLAEAGGAPRPRSLPKSLALIGARAGERLARVAPIEAALTEASIHYVCRETEYSLDTARSVLGYAPRVDLAESLRQLRIALRQKAKPHRETRRGS